MKTPSDEHVDPDIVEILSDVVESLPEADIKNSSQHFLHRRVHPRKLCIVPVEHRAGGGSCCHNLTLDISVGGVFIETCELHDVGQESLLSLLFPGRNEPFRVAGRVAWKGPNGVGVKFEGLSEEDRDTLCSIIEEL